MLGLFRIERFDQRNPAAADRMLPSGSGSGHQSWASGFHPIQSENLPNLHPRVDDHSMPDGNGEDDSFLNHELLGRSRFQNPNY